MKIFGFKKKKEATVNPFQSEAERRIDSLKVENDRLYNELEILKGREQVILDSINFAQKTAQAYQEDAKRKCKIECDRLNNFREKWTEFVKTLDKSQLLREEIERTNDFLEECQNELDFIIQDNLGIENTEEFKKLNEEVDELSDEDLDKLIAQITEG